MEIPTLLFFGSIGVMVIVLIILRSQRSAAAGFASLEKERAAWAKARPSVAKHLELADYRVADNGGRGLIGLGRQVDRILAEYRPARFLRTEATLPDADLRALAALVEAHHQVRSRGGYVEGELMRVVNSRVRAPEERRIMMRAFRRTVLGLPESEIVALLVDKKVSVKRRLAAEKAVAAGIALVDERNKLGEFTESFVEALTRAESAYLDARQLLRG